MLQIILDKLGFDSVESFLKSENEFINSCKGMEVDRPNPFAILNFDELNFFQDYVNSHNLI